VAVTERVTVRLPDGFNPDRHATALARLIAKRHGEGFEIVSIDPAGGTAYATRHVAITEVSAADTAREHFDVRLARGTKPADGDRLAAKLAEQNPGYEMTAFEPFLGRATLGRLDEATSRCRSAVAVALGVKPWSVRARPRTGGGFDLALPESYSPSRHDRKLAEVATTVVGGDGWYVDADPRTLTASIIPAEPPTFPAVLPYPLDLLGRGDPTRLRLGRALPAPGHRDGPEVQIDWSAQSFVLLAGMSGSGKTNLLNAAIAGALADRAELAILDLPSKSVDFLWCKPFVRPAGWGCDSPEAAVTVLGMILAEGQRRARVLARAGVVNWLELPPENRFRPILLVVDEASGLLLPDRTPAGIPKDHPLALEAANLLKAALASSINKIIAELRFVGVRMLLASQVTNNSTGIGPSLKSKIGHKILQGANPSRTARTQAFSDESAVPVVPANVRADPDAAKGTGVAELEGSEPVVYKAYFATTSDYSAALTRLGVPTADAPAPTAEQIARHSPVL
jgi:hypothetical protein